jgi:hypothetical protein
VLAPITGGTPTLVLSGSSVRYQGGASCDRPSPPPRHSRRPTVSAQFRRLLGEFVASGHEQPAALQVEVLLLKFSGRLGAGTHLHCGSTGQSLGRASHPRRSPLQERRPPNFDNANGRQRVPISPWGLSKLTSPAVVAEFILPYREPFHGLLRLKRLGNGRRDQCWPTTQ